MKRKFVVARALEAVAMVLFVFLVIAPWLNTSKAVYGRIKIGMTEAQVDAIIPVNPLGIKDGTIWLLASGDDTKIETEGDLVSVRSGGHVKYGKAWRIDTAFIIIGVDVNGRVIAKQFMPLHSAKTSWLDNLIAWLKGNSYPIATNGQ